MAAIAGWTLCAIPLDIHGTLGIREEVNYILINFKFIFFVPILICLVASRHTWALIPGGHELK